MRRFFSFGSSPNPKQKLEKEDQTARDSHEEFLSGNELLLPNHRRSQSYSSNLGERSSPQKCESPIQFQGVREHKNFHSHSSRGYYSSCPSSPVGLKLKPTRLSTLSNTSKSPEWYTNRDDKEEEEAEENNKKGNTATVHRKPPRIHSVTSSPPTYSESILRTRSFRDVRRSHEHLSTASFSRDQDVQDIYEDVPLQGEDSDESLYRKSKEAEGMFMRISNEKFTKGLGCESLVRIIGDLNEERRCLALELTSQIKSRLSDRVSARERYKKSWTELEEKTRQVERESGLVQWAVERELDQRLRESFVKIQKSKAEEERLENKVRELAEHNVSLQKQVGLLREIEMEKRELEKTLEEVKKENSDLGNALKEWQGSFRDKIEESRDINKAVARLEKIKVEQAKTISGLVQGLKEKKEKSFYEHELIRLTSVEQCLRKEVESHRCELELVKKENRSILDRLKGDCTSLDMEICARIEFLQCKGLSLLTESSLLSEKLLDFVKRKRKNEDLEGYELMENTLKWQSMKREIESLRRSAQNIVMAFDSKSRLKNEFSEMGEENGAKDQIFEDETRLKLKQEVMLNKILREKLFSEEQELEELQSEMASLVRKNHLLEDEIKRLRDEISRLAQRAEDMDLEIMRKDEKADLLRQERQEMIEELNLLTGKIRAVAEERDSARQEGKQLREANGKMQEEIISLSQKVEEKDTEILFEDGQIKILQEKIKELQKGSHARF